jgi:site-specific recombinase XerD
MIIRVSDCCLFLAIARKLSEKTLTDYIRHIESFAKFLDRSLGPTKR